MKKCKTCKIEKEILEFYSYKSRGTKYYTSECKKCRKIRSYKWLKKNPEVNRKSSLAYYHANKVLKNTSKNLLVKR